MVGIPLIMQPWYGDDRWVHLCRTVATREGTSHEKPPRPPASLNHLLVLRHALDLSLPFHAVVWGAALATFFGCHRLGETTVRNLSSADPIFNVMRSSDVMLRTLSDGTRSLDFHIPWTKATREQGANVILTARSDCLCPCAAVLNHFMVNNNIPPGEPLFSYKLPDGCHRPLTKQDFLSLLTRSGPMPVSSISMAIASELAALSNSFLQVFPLRLSLQLVAGHLLPSFCTGGVSRKSFP